MGLNLNLADAQTGGFDPVPAGNYHVAITDYEMREAGENAKHPGSQYINWELTIQDGAFESRRLWTNTTLVEGATFGIVNLLAAAGYSGNIDLDEILEDTEDLLGREMVVTVRIKKATEQYEASNEVKRFKAYDPNATSPASSGSSLLP